MWLICRVCIVSASEGIGRDSALCPATDICGAAHESHRDVIEQSFSL